MIRTRDNQLYTGITTDVQRRWEQHASGLGAKYFRAHEPAAIVYVEQLLGRSEASKREYALKQFSKANKEALIAEHSSDTKSALALWQLNTSSPENNCA